MNREERKALAEMNLRAGLKASDHAAFDTAAVYFKAGRELLGSNAWVEGEDEFNTMLKLCCEEANSCYIIGDYDTMNVLINEVLSKDVPIKDSFKVYEVKILAMKAKHQFLDAITTAMDVRRQLGLSAPPNKPTSTLTVVKEYIKTNRAVKGRTAEELVALPELKDERIIMGQRMLELLMSACYQGQPTLFPLISFLSVRTSVKHGINASSCDAFATYGLLLT
jgi:predicted ATPase